jgi:two-component system sensor histidine kinase HydH
MKPLASIGVILFALAGVLGLSISSARHDERQLLAEFTASTQQQLHTSVQVLSTRLDALHQDTRLLVDLVERERSLDADEEKRIWSGAFQALAGVVPHYRFIALFADDGRLIVSASDPTETAPTIQALSEHSRRLGLEIARQGQQSLGKPAFAYGSRSFWFYGAPVRGAGGALVVASDAALFLHDVAWTSLPLARLFVTDPASVVWSGCETAIGCRETRSDIVQKYISPAHTSLKRIEPEMAQALGMTYAPAVMISERVEQPTGDWTVTWLASTRAIMTRERSALARVVLAALAAAVAVAAVGIFILRQQRQAVTLAGQLRYAQALASARQTSQSIVENAPLGVLGVSQDGRVALANGFLVDRVGPVRVGAPLKEAVTGEGAELVQHLLPLLARRTPVAGEASTGPELRALSTSSHHFHVRVVPVENADLGIGAFALIEDQSALRSLENQLVRAEKLISVGVLSAGIAHEIGSPLAVIRGRAEQVLRDTAPGPRAEDLRVIIKHIDRITSTIRQLLDFSRRQPIAPRAVSLAVTIERARELLQWKFESKELELRVTLDDDLPMLAADPDQLQQVIVNLLLNACDASPPMGQVAIKARRLPGQQVELEIADRGHGIAPEHLHAVFDPFFSTKKRGEGTGLGLSIVASIVRNHAGEISLDSATGKGTTVTVRWPAHREVAHG